MALLVTVADSREIIGTVGRKMGNDTNLGQVRTRDTST